jgi:16S rRNA C967 or C1407 C5-methylase (RsmB/RsmF family)/NOL1/NOP2/fmu family ribosome biogenesis protein
MSPYSDAFLQAMKCLLKEDYEAFFNALSQPTPTSLRLNPFKPLAQNPLGTPVPWAPEGVYLPERPSFALDPLWHAGGYYVQEASSMFLRQALLQVFNSLEAPLCLDLCAAPGGKSSHIASLLPVSGMLVCNEVIPSRASVLKENLSKWGSTNTFITRNEVRDFQSLTGLFDLILLDAPCSGEGLFRKDPQAVSEWSEKAVQRCADRQRQLLAQAWECLSEGGFLVYSTCTYNRTENEDILHWASAKFSLRFIEIPIQPDWHVQPSSDLPGYRFYPHKLNGEGLFMAIVQKTGSSSRHSPNSRKKPLPFSTAARKDTERVANWLLTTEGEWIRKADRLLFLPEGGTELLEKLASVLQLLHAGTEVANVFHGQQVPLPGLALSSLLHPKAFPHTTLTLEEALHFLRKEDIPIAHPGWSRAMYQGLTLGFVKKSADKVSNYYPKEWRLRMQLA